MGIALPDPEPEETYGVWKDCWPAVEIFLRCQTQWRASMSGVIGLDYVAVATCLNLYGIENQRQVFEDLQVIESTALKILNAQEK